MKRSKQPYHSKFFEPNNYNIKNTWKGIKSLISQKTGVPTLLSLDNGDTITNPYDIANTFNHCFLFIAETNMKKHKNIFRMNAVVKYFCKEKSPNAVSFLNPLRLFSKSNIPYRK